jgi:hypothetical protein
LFVFLLCTICCQLLWMVHLWYSLMFIQTFDMLYNFNVRVSHMEQEVLIPPEHPSSPWFSVWCSCCSTCSFLCSVL